MGSGDGQRHRRPCAASHSCATRAPSRSRVRRAAQQDGARLAGVRVEPRVQRGGEPSRSVSSGAAPRGAQAARATAIAAGGSSA
jgi:hypothetical protein